MVSVARADILDETVGYGDLTFNRRTFISGVAASLAAMAVSPAQAAVNGRPRRLLIENLHTGERVDAVYWESGKYQADALEALDMLMRDHRCNEICAIDVRLYDAMYALSKRIDAKKHLELVSGYRSPATNALLRQAGTGVAKKSYHMRGMAVDVRVRGMDLNRLHAAAKSLWAGGVGKYPKSNFVHMDVGPVRYW